MKKIIVTTKNGNTGKFYKDKFVKTFDYSKFLYTSHWVFLYKFLYNYPNYGHMDNLDKGLVEFIILVSKN